MPLAGKFWAPTGGAGYKYGGGGAAKAKTSASISWTKAVEISKGASLRIFCKFVICLRLLTTTLYSSARMQDQYRMPSDILIF